MKTFKDYTLIKSYTFPFGKVCFYENFLITEIKEGFLFDITDARKVSELVTVHFQNNPFAYISNRIHSYSLVPMNYLRIKEVFPTIKAFAAVTYSDVQKSVVALENNFLEVPLVNFETLDEAIHWAQEKLKE